MEDHVAPGVWPLATGAKGLFRGALLSAGNEEDAKGQSGPATLPLPKDHQGGQGWRHRGNQPWHNPHSLRVEPSSLDDFGFLAMLSPPAFVVMLGDSMKSPWQPSSNTPDSPGFNSSTSVNSLFFVVISIQCRSRRCLWNCSPSFWSWVFLGGRIGGGMEGGEGHSPEIPPRDSSKRFLRFSGSFRGTDHLGAIFKLPGIQSLTQGDS